MGGMRWDVRGALGFVVRALGGLGLFAVARVCKDSGLGLGLDGAW